MRRIIVSAAVTLFLASWVPQVSAQDFMIRSVSRTINVSASAGNAGEPVANRVSGPCLGDETSTISATVTTLSPINPWIYGEVTATGGVSINMRVRDYSVELAATSNFVSGYFTGVGSSFLGDASVVFVIPSLAKPDFTFTARGMASCGATLTGPSGDVWRAYGVGIADIQHMDPAPPVLQPGEYTLSIVIEPQVTVGN
ncbi:MAG TPA: hypothetical protein VHP11_11235, partial [Tepidisphaeraceae bacterium]|nr:hypothetical protein [Tepidisphaeraceae bacterium]